MAQFIRGDGKPARGFFVVFFSMVMLWLFFAAMVLLVTSPDEKKLQEAAAPEFVSSRTELQLGDSLEHRLGRCARIVLFRPGGSIQELQEWRGLRFVTDAHYPGLGRYRTAAIIDPELWNRIRPTVLPSLVVTYRNRVVYSGPPEGGLHLCERIEVQDDE